jgi:hypothetical protein
MLKTTASRAVFIKVAGYILVTLSEIILKIKFELAVSSVQLLLYVM